jgi:C-terminal processing protease CtpA/Prc
MFVRDVLDQYYLWYRELPRANPANYASPEAYLEAVRFRPLDDSFSYITSRAANEAFYGDSQFVGYGFSTQVVERELRVLQVFPEGPAAESGMARGDRILEIDDRSVGELIDTGEINTAFGPSTPGVTSRVLVRSRDGDERRSTLTKRVVTIPTVSLTRTFRVDGRTVGYLFFRNFVEPSVAALDEAFAALREAGATELILDVRYNGGGLVDVAVHLAGLIGGVPTQGRVFATYQHNDRNTRLDTTLRFPDAPPQALSLSRVVVITTRGSASASELLINSLRPHLPVVVIGDAT